MIFFIILIQFRVIFTGRHMKESIGKVNAAFPTPIVGPRPVMSIPDVSHERMEYRWLPAGDRQFSPSVQSVGRPPYQQSNDITDSAIERQPITRDGRPSRNEIRVAWKGWFQ